MSQNDDRDPEKGGDDGIVSAALPSHLKHSPTCMAMADHSCNQPSPRPTSPQLSPPRGKSSFSGDSAPHFSMYSKITAEEDIKMVDRWQKDADGILLFATLFSAAIAVLLSVAIQNLIPNSQDTSSFYLGNIYEVLADPNATRASIPPPIAKPPPFSPPAYAIWVNSLWFLSLFISLTCALFATSSQQWARRYLRVTEPKPGNSEQDALMRIFYFCGLVDMNIVGVLDGLTAMLHLSVFIFFGGAVIFLFHINHAVFKSVVWWIGLFLFVYVLITLMPIFRHNSPYYSPLSTSVWFLYSSISYLLVEVLVSMYVKIFHRDSWPFKLELSRRRYRLWAFGGVEMAAKETTSKLSSMFYFRILGWTINALNNDDRLEEFFESIAGFFHWKDLGQTASDDLLETFWNALHGFIQRTLLFNRYDDKAKSRRLVIGMNAISVIIDPRISSIPGDVLFQTWNQNQQDLDVAYTLAPWFASNNRDIAQYARCIATRILASVPQRHRDFQWARFATNELGFSAVDLWNYVHLRNDSMLLAILINVVRRDIRSHFFDWGILSTLSGLDINNTDHELQHEFCTLWNDFVEEARIKGPDTYPAGVLRLTRHLYIGLHQGTPAAPTDPFALADDSDSILFQPDSYPSCHIPDHRPEPFQAPAGDSPAPSVHSVPRPTGGSRSGGVAAASRDITPTVTLFHSLESDKQQDIAAPWVAPDIGQIWFTKLTSCSAPMLATPVLNESLASYYVSPTSTSKSLVPVSFASPPSHIPPSANAELLALLSGTPLFTPPDNATLPRLRARGLINNGNMCFVNAVLQLLVYCPPFWNHSRDLGRLMGQRGQGKGQLTGSGMTVLVDATIRFLDEFMYKEKPSLTQQSLQVAKTGTARDEKEKKADDNTDPFVPTYMYDAMKGKRQFNDILDGRQQDAQEFFSVFLSALDEELLALLASINTLKLASATLDIEELKEGSQSGGGQIEVGKRDYIASSVKSPISHIFDGKFRTTKRVIGQPDVVTIEAWRSLQLDIQSDSIHTIQDALALISRPHSVQVSPSGPSQASQQVTVLIEALPPVLVLHLKRFVYDATTGGVVKIDKPVHFAPKLKIPPDIMASATGQLALPERYMLYGVLYYHGASARGGHYTVDVLHLNAPGDGGEAWLHIDDETVSTVRHEDVFGRYDNERADDRCAYMLFYCRVASSQM